MLCAQNVWGSQMKKIVFTGGGTAGHATPNIALMEKLDRNEWEVHYIGTADGVEKQIVGSRDDVIYHEIAWGKLRRYFDWRNFTDPFRVIKGYFQSRKILKELKPAVLFSKGGFVSVPVVAAAKGKCPVIAHESDYTPGLANRLAAGFATKICVSFSDTVKYVPKGKGVHTGTPIRPELYRGSREKGLAFTGFSGEKPVLLMMGGSLGAQAVNDALREALPVLLPVFDIVHLCGKGKMEKELDLKGYVQYEYINEELPDLLAMADIILSRAGANAVFELLALRKPMLLVPLTAKSTRGDQLLNAEYFERNGYAKILLQQNLTPVTLSEALNDLYKDREKYQRAMETAENVDGTQPILNIILQAAGE